MYQYLFLAMHFSKKINDEKIVYSKDALPVKIGFRLLTKYTQQYKNALHL